MLTRSLLIWVCSIGLAIATLRTLTITTLRTLTITTLMALIITTLGALAITALRTLAITTLLRTLTITTLGTLAIATLRALTITTLRTLAIATLTLLAITTLIVITRTIATTLWGIALQTCAKAFGTETTIIIVLTIVWTFKAGARSSCMDTRTRRASLSYFSLNTILMCWFFVFLFVVLKIHVSLSF
jgi:hypothetical protein